MTSANNLKLGLGLTLWERSLTVVDFGFPFDLFSLKVYQYTDNYLILNCAFTGAVDLTAVVAGSRRYHGGGDHLVQTYCTVSEGFPVKTTRFIYFSYASIETSSVVITPIFLSISHDSAGSSTIVSGHGAIFYKTIITV